MINTLILATALFRQDAPTDIPRAELPKSAKCVVCTANGAGHEEEEPAAGVRFKGHDYFFCNKKEVATFKKDPDAYIPPVLPRPMPKFDLADLSGKTWDKEAFKGKVVLVDFWATWCGPCKQVKPIVAEVAKANKGVIVLSVSIDEKKSDLEKFLSKERFEGAVLHDSKQIWAEWRVRAIPALFLVKDGVIIRQWRGVLEKDELHKHVNDAASQVKN